MSRSLVACAWPRMIVPVAMMPSGVVTLKMNSTASRSATAYGAASAGQWQRLSGSSTTEANGAVGETHAVRPHPVERPDQRERHSAQAARPQQRPKRIRKAD